LEIDLPEVLPEILAKAVPLEQVLLNLVVNACDASAMCVSRPGADARLIRISAVTSGDRVSLAVCDHAGGIPPDVLPRIFEPFFTTKSVGLGTGLGLSISQRIIEEMGATLTAENRDGGACFTIDLPGAGFAAADKTRPREPPDICC
jgi:C4-dicarboxylate-specific signal transduction histidine kinase